MTECYSTRIRPPMSGSRSRGGGPRRCVSSAQAEDVTRSRRIRSGRRAAPIRHYSSCNPNDSMNNSSFNNSFNSSFNNSFNSSFNNNNNFDNSWSSQEPSSAYNDRSRRSNTRSTSSTASNSTCSSIDSCDFDDDVLNNSTLDQIFVSDIAYVDYYLNGNGNSDTINISKFRLENSMQRKFDVDNTYVIQYKHELTYKDETIWVMQTCYKGSGDKITGKSSTCHMTMDGQLNIRVNHKVRRQRNSSADNSKSSSSSRATSAATDNPRHTRKLKLDILDILKRSADAYEQEALRVTSQH